MLRRAIASLIVILSIGFLTKIARGAGFTNLDFEDSGLPVDSAVTFPPDPVSTSLLFPSWTLRFGESIQSTAWFNTYYLAGGNAALMSSSMPDSNVLQGMRSLYLAGWTSPTSISQIGDVPAATRSVRLLTKSSSSATPDSLLLAMDGQNVQLNILSRSGDIFTLGGDVSTWAGMNSELRISAAGFGPNADAGAFLVDRIQFSPTEIPEPAFVSIAAVGMICLMRRL